MHENDATNPPLGAMVGRDRWSPEPGVIGRVSQAPAGNTVLEVGRLLTDGGWLKTEGHGHIVLTPGERERLIAALVAQRNGEEA